MSSPLRPPVDVQRPQSVTRLPEAPHHIFDVKLDGWRTIAFIDETVVLQARSGRIISTQFPEVLAGLATLPVGTVLDGEVVAVRGGGRFDFHALAGSAAQRRRAGVAVSYVAFDVLADAGERVTGLPLSERRARLTRLLAEHPPGLEPVMSTADRDEALAWLEALAPLGVEGLVAKDVRRPYRAGAGRGWWKFRVADSVDATLIGVVGSGIKPDALRVKFDDGREAVTALLSDLQRRQLVEGVRAAGDGPIRVEVRVTGAGGRHRNVQFLRVRQD
jgi:ATP-dependent DNA ligase